VAREDFFRATVLELMIVSKDEVFEVVSAPEGVSAISNATGSAVEDEAMLDSAAGEVTLSPASAVTGRFRRETDRFGFLAMAMVAFNLIPGLRPIPVSDGNSY